MELDEHVLSIFSNRSPRTMAPSVSRVYVLLTRVPLRRLARREGEHAAPQRREATDHVREGVGNVLCGIDVVVEASRAALSSERA